MAAEYLGLEIIRAKFSWRMLGQDGSYLVPEQLTTLVRRELAKLTINPVLDVLQAHATWFFGVPKDITNIIRTCIADGDNFLGYRHSFAPPQLQPNTDLESRGNILLHLAVPHYAARYEYDVLDCCDSAGTPLAMEHDNGSSRTYIWTVAGHELRRDYYFWSQYIRSHLRGGYDNGQTILYDYKTRRIDARRYIMGVRVASP